MLVSCGSLTSETLLLEFFLLVFWACLTSEERDARQQPLGFLANQTVDTKWGSAVLVEECEGNGWNVDFGEEHPGNFFLDQTEFAACAHPPR